MSAVDKDDIAKLHKMIRAFFARRLVKAELFLPWSAQKLRGELFANCEVLEERADADGTFFRVRGERKDIDGLRERIGQAQGVPLKQFKPCVLSNPPSVTDGASISANLRLQMKTPPRGWRFHLMVGRGELKHRPNDSNQPTCKRIIGWASDACELRAK